MQLIIVEGIDRIGKTTYIQKLAAHLRLAGKDVILDLHESTWVPDIPLNKKPHCYEFTNAFTMTYFIEVMNMLKYKSDLVMIVDRYHVSALAYGVIKRRNNVEILYGTIDRYHDEIIKFEKALMAAVGYNRLHYIQFIAKKIGIADDETKIDQLHSINLRMNGWFHSSKIKSKHKFNLKSDESFQTDILDYIEPIKNLICKL